MVCERFSAWGRGVAAALSGRAGGAPAGLRRRAECLLGCVEFRDWDFEVVEKGGCLFLRVAFDAPCNHTGELSRQTGRKWYLSPYMTDSEIVGTALKAALTAVEHEAREEFRWREKAIFGPHFDIRALGSISEAVDVRA